MNCVFCNKQILNAGGLKKHENGCLKNPNRVLYKNNFLDYNEKVRAGYVKGSNQYIDAKKHGTRVLISGDTRLKLSKARKGKACSIEQKEKLSTKRSEFLEEVGKGGFKSIKWYSIKNISGEEYIVRGTWELRVANVLNENNILWKRKVYLKYKDDKSICRTYCPDFYIPTINRYVEVKGYFSFKDKCKLKSVILENDIDLVLITGKDLNDSLISNIMAPVSPHAYTM